MIDFRNYYTQEEFNELKSFSKVGYESKDYSNLKTAKNILGESIKKFLEENIKLGNIKFEIIKQHKIYFLDIMYDSNKQGFYSIILDMILHNFDYFIGENQEDYASLCDFINEGDITKVDFIISGSDRKCQRCGKDLKVILKKWNPVFIYKDEDSFKCLPYENINTEITFKTSKLLISDYFRINEFTNILKESKSYHTSLNSESGIISRTEDNISQYNLVTVFTLSTPHIILEDNNLFFGEIKDSKKGYKLEKSKNNLGSIFMDMWNVNIIEKEQLIQLISTKVGLDKSKEIVENYILSEKNNLIECEIEPGKYNLSYNSNFEIFQSKTKDSIDGMKLLFSLKKVND